MKHKYLLCFVLVCLLLYCYYKPVVEGIDPKDDTSRYAFKDDTSYTSDDGMTTALGAKKKVEKCDRKEGEYTSIKEVIDDPNAGTRNHLCFKNIKCTDLLVEKQVGCDPFGILGCAGLEVDFIDKKNPDPRPRAKGKGFEVLKRCIKGSEEEHRGTYYLGRIKLDKAQKLLN